LRVFVSSVVVENEILGGIVEFVHAIEESQLFLMWVPRLVLADDCLF